jgi:hypothetical protein
LVATAADLPEDGDETAWLRELARLVDVEYDIVLAGARMRKAEESLEEEACQRFQVSPIVKRLKQELGCLQSIGRAVCKEETGWFNIYKAERSSIDAFIDPNDHSAVKYVVRVVLPSNLVNAIAVLNEIQLLQTWNKLVTGTPKTVGERMALHYVIHYQMSLVGGLYKLDILNRVRRFVDVDGGFLAEYIASVPSDSELYRPPLPRHKRPQTTLKNIWLACGPDKTLMLQVGKVRLPFAAGPRLARTIGALAGNAIVGNMSKNSLLAASPNSPWQGPIKEDAFGLYSLLERCVASKGSCGRTPQTKEAMPSVSESELADLFATHSGRDQLDASRGSTLGLDA